MPDFRYWHEPMDAGNFMNSVVLDPVLGFGGNGSGPDRCITDGPFKDYTNHLGPYWAKSDHCLFRFVNETMTNRSAQYFVDNCMAQPDFYNAWQCIEGRPHEGGHGGVGGQVSFKFIRYRSKVLYLQSNRCLTPLAVQAIHSSTSTTHGSTSYGGTGSLLIWRIG